MWYTFFVMGGFWFWALVVIEFGLLSLFVQDENSLGSFLSVLIFVLLIHLFGDSNLFTYIKDNPLDVVRLSLLYCGIGFCWACCKFYFISKRTANVVNSIKKDFIANLDKISSNYDTVISSKYNKVENTSRDSEDIWKWYLNQECVFYYKEKLSFAHQGTKIIFWLAYWPISLFWTLFTDILRNFAEWCYETFLIKLFRSIHDQTVGKALELDTPIIKPKD